MQKERTKMLGTAPEMRLLIKLSVPAVIGLFVQALYNVVDSVFIAHYSTEALSALTLCFPVQLVIISLAVGIEVGGNSLISRLLGANRLLRANEAAEHLLGLIFIFGILSALVGFFFSRDLIALFSNDPRLLDVGASYLKIILLGSVTVYIPMVLCGILRAEGNSIIPMVTMVLGGVLNIALDPWFIFGGWGLAPMGVEGAAWATVLARVVSSLFVIFVLLFGNNQIAVKRFHLAFDYRLIFEIFKVGFPIAMVEFLGSVMMAVANKLVGVFGINALAALGIYFRMHLFILLPVLGIGQGLMPIVGYNFGHQKMTRVKNTIKHGLVLGSLLCFLGFIFFFCFPELLLSLFGAEGELREIGISVLKIASLGFPLLGVSVIGSISFQGFGVGYPPFIESLIRQIVVLLPAMWILGKLYGLPWLWYSIPLSELFSFLIIVAFMVVLLPKLMAQKEPVSDV